MAEEACAAPVAIVTGAGSGIGRAVAERLGREGYRLALVGRRREKLEETARRLHPPGPSGETVLALAADLSDAREVGPVIERVLGAWGRVDALVNNAGVAELRDIAATDADLLARVFAVNTFAPALLIARLWPVFREHGGGRIVNVSSLASSDPFPGYFVYAASKAAIESLTRPVCGEGAALGIRGFSVAPGAVETPMLRACFSDHDLPPSRTLSPAAVAEVVCACVLGRCDDQAGSVIAVALP